MFQPNSFHTERIHESLCEIEPQSRLDSHKPSAMDVEGRQAVLLESLLPQGLSPAKRAVIERLVTLWLADSKFDIA